MLVYIIRNKINGKAYIGQTIHTLEERVRLHLSSRSGCLGIKSAIKKYGIKNFEIQELARAETLEQLNLLEIQYITNLNTLAPNGYNLKTGGSRPTYSEESRKKMSLSHKGRKQNLSPEARAALSERSRKIHLGKKFTEEHKIKLRAAKQLAVRSGKATGESHHMYGKFHTKKARKKNSLKAKGRTPWNKGKKTDPLSVQKSVAARTRTYLVVCENQEKKTFFGLKSVSKFTGIPLGSLCGLGIPKAGFISYCNFLIGIK